jgi:hypothetical protein
MIFSRHNTIGCRALVTPGQSPTGSIDLVLECAGAFRIIDSNGHVVGSVTAEILPPPPTPPRVKLNEEQTAMRIMECHPCDQNEHMTLRDDGPFPVKIVKCNACGCGGLKLDDPDSRCPLKKWPAAV